MATGAFDLGIETEISWADSTVNWWLGCQRLTLACDNCYAEALVTRYGWTTWGPHGERKRTSAAYWKQPFRWQRNASKFQFEHGHRQRVFSSSLSDFFDNRAPKEWRDEAWTIIRDTPDLDWLVLTKRPENILRFLPPDWDDGYPNVWLGTTTEDQDNYDRRWRKLAAIPAKIRFVSYEPAMGPLTLHGSALPLPDWLIYGGESGPKARVADWRWGMRIMNECAALGVACFVKQHGTYASNPLGDTAEARRLDPPSNGKGGALLRGYLIREFPV
jgi:protein gp37